MTTTNERNNRRTLTRHRRQHCKMAQDDCASLVERTYATPQVRQVPSQEVKKYLAHDGEECRSGPWRSSSRLAATRPMSKRKRWLLTSVVEKADLPEMSNVEGRSDHRNHQ